MKRMMLVILIGLFILPMVYAETSCEDVKKGQDKLRIELGNAKEDFIKETVNLGDLYIGRLEAIKTDLIWAVGIAVFCGMLGALSLFHFVKHKLEKYKQDLLIDSAPINAKVKKK